MSLQFIESWVRALVNINPQQMSHEEYMYIVRLVQVHQPCKLLVFGVGRDSPLWHMCNLEGETVFVEDNPKWVAEVNDMYASFLMDVRLITYTTTVGEHAECKDRKVLWLPDLPKDDWRVIIVDGPAGNTDDAPGRMQSIFGAWILGNDTHVIVHDCDRPIEDKHSRHWLGSGKLVQEIGKLRHYYVEGGNPDAD